MREECKLRAGNAVAIANAPGHSLCARKDFTRVAHTSLFNTYKKPTEAGALMIYI